MMIGKAVRLLVMAGLALASPALAYQNGEVWGAARGAGCSCHQFGPGTSPTQVKLFVREATAEAGATDNGQLLEQFEGYTPGTPYILRTWVLGPSVTATAGFNLEVTSGTLQSIDQSTQARVADECEYMASATNCKGAGCQVLLTDACPLFDGLDSDCRLCPSRSLGDPAVCRPCDLEAIARIEATHTTPKSLPYFDVLWTAPAEPADVQIFLAGNAVNAGGPQADFWNFAEPNPLVLHPAP